jgi:hypothetical protein
MRKIIRSLILVAPLCGVATYIAISGTPVSAGDETKVMDPFDNDVFPRQLKYLFPPPVPFLSNPDRSFNKIECSDGVDNDGNGKVDDSEELCNSVEHVAFGYVDESEELEQPVHYSHKLHAGKLQIECEYCHTYARRSIHAGIPPLQICMNCHADNKVPSEGRSDRASKDLKYLRDHFRNNEEIPWVKVHDLPDYVYFSHKRHVTSGVICQECHGEVQADMTVARRVGDLTMGWCLDCHESHPSVDDNYCGKDKTGCSEAELRRAEIKDCWNCHK